MSCVLSMLSRLFLSLQLCIALHASQRELIHICILSRALCLFGESLCHLIDESLLFDREKCTWIVAIERLKEEWIVVNAIVEQKTSHRIMSIFAKAIDHGVCDVDDVEFDAIVLTENGDLDCA